MAIRSSTSLQPKTVTGVASVDDFGAVGDGVFGGGTDSTAAFQAAIDWVAANPGPSGGGQVIIPPGSWRITAPLIVPSYVSFQGYGDDSQVLMDNDVLEVYGGGLANGDPGGIGFGLFNIFTQNPWNGNAPYFTNCQFRDFRVTGENDPYVQVDQWQSAAIDMSNFAEDMAIHNVTFEKLHGFAIHGRGNGDGLDVTGCRFIQTGNSGVNTGISNAKIAYNKFSYSEGIEVTGRNCQVIGNTFENCGNTSAPNQVSPTVVLGGNITPSGNFPGGTVMGNSIADCTGGIYVGSNATDFSIVGNTIIRVNGYGVILTGAGIAGQEPHRSIVANNVIRSAGSDAAATMYGIWVAVGTEQAVIANNNIELNFETGYNGGVFGIRSDSPGGVVRGNHVSGASTRAYYFRNAADMVFEGNSAEGNTDIDYDSTVSFRSSLSVGSASVRYNHTSGGAATFVAGDKALFTQLRADNNAAGDISLDGATSGIVLAADTGEYEVSIWADTESPAAGDATTLEVLVNGAAFSYMTVNEPSSQTASWMDLVDTTGAAQTIKVNRSSVTGTGRLDVKVKVEQLGS